MLSNSRGMIWARFQHPSDGGAWTAPPAIATRRMS